MWENALVGGLGMDVTFDVLVEFIRPPSNIGVWVMFSADKDLASVRNWPHHARLRNTCGNYVDCQCATTLTVAHFLNRFHVIPEPLGNGTTPSREEQEKSKYFPIKENKGDRSKKKGQQEFTGLSDKSGYREENKNYPQYKAQSVFHCMLHPT